MIASIAHWFMVVTAGISGLLMLLDVWATFYTKQVMSVKLEIFEVILGVGCLMSAAFMAGVLRG